MKKNASEVRERVDTFVAKSLNVMLNEAEQSINAAKSRQLEMDGLALLAGRLSNESRAAQHAVAQTFKESEHMVHTLADFEAVVANGRSRYWRVEPLTAAVSGNIERLWSEAQHVSESASTLVLIVGQCDMIKTNVNETLHANRPKVGKLTRDAAELDAASRRLDRHVEELVDRHDTHTLARASQARQLGHKLATHSDKLFKRVERLSNGTQRLLDVANNAMFALARVDSSIASKCI